ncbi:8-amino-7-oxononanoate synthase [Candidatus Liberibacter americanus]|uniref:7-keto-8-aminopelargonate synthetase n=1 Tax=Candidatus Liberibacter americanus str. Sao Paulo TaxID=1261131 RepID=U6B6K0_9HYPH|nr:8-amino-7-oxononanoate synthase [Candidatus Liberibacter americanus]AHA27496.1 7-keto-8-aminopelargonate synthetase [Candidatus Liberibacter americanus str. Sao Paulo]EMS36542.1 8-amino-7-oxononanoate synthase [Candidatus Liberibacter americanus PW_SP]
MHENVKMYFYEKKLQRLKLKGRYRKLLNSTNGIDFTSHDYLALSSSPILREKISTHLNSNISIGSGGSRLLRGNHEHHIELEEEAADFFGFEKMMYFGSGYTANIAVLSTLPQAKDLIVYDKLVHASIRDGIKLGVAEAISVAHNDINAFADAINKWRKSGGTGLPWIVIESIYSMDGDIAPLNDLVKIASDCHGFLFVDEAHATGVCGQNGKGLTYNIKERDSLIVMHSCSKALGASGALVGLKKIMYDYLINYAKPFIYTTSPSPLLTIATQEALRIIKRDQTLNESLTRLIDSTDKIANKKLGFSSKSHIQPIIIGDDISTLKISKKLQSIGFDIRAVRPPTVPVNKSRLRISITLNVDVLKIVKLFDIIPQIISEENS